MTLERQQLPKDLPFQVVVILRYSFEASLRCLLQEGVKTENDHINLKVAGQDGSVVQFKIKRHTPLSKLMKAYCERQVRRLAPPRGFPVCALVLCAPGIPRARVSGLDPDVATRGALFMDGQAGACAVNLA